MISLMKKYDCSQVKAAPHVVLPHPCDGPLYDSWTDDDYLMKVMEEVNEVVEAHNDLKNANQAKHPGAKTISLENVRTLSQP